MSCTKTFKPGDVVYKRESAGYVGVGSYGVILDDGYDDWGCVRDEQPEHKNCREWSTIALIDADSAESAKEKAANGDYAGGCAYHVSECEMTPASEESEATI